MDGGTWREGREMTKKGGRGPRDFFPVLRQVYFAESEHLSLLSHPERHHSSMGQGAPVSFRKASEELESQWFRVCACVWPSSLPIPGWEKQTTVTCSKGLIPML